MKKKLITVLLVMVGLGMVFFAILTFFGFFKAQEAGILIEASPESTVYINSIEVGKTPYEANLEAEEILLRIKPNLTNKVLDDYETKIKLVSGIRTIVKRVFSETEEFSSGAVVSFEKLGGKESYVTIVSIPDNSQVIIDGRVYGYTPLRVEIPAGDHSLSVSSDKYLEKLLKIKVYAGYKLTASVKLAKTDENKSQEEVVDLNTTD